MGQDKESQGSPFNIVRRIFELLLSIFGIKLGSGGGPPPTPAQVADHINKLDNLGDHLANNAGKLALANKLLGIPGVSDMAVNMAKDVLKPYLDSPEVKAALNGQFNGPQGDKIREELAKYPNICTFLNGIIQNTKCADMAPNVGGKAPVDEQEMSSPSNSEVPSVPVSSMNPLKTEPVPTASAKSVNEEDEVSENKTP